MEAALQPATVPAGFLREVSRWAEDQPSPVSLILFGSRARGDHRPGSDWDFALVYDGEPPSYDGLPWGLGGYIDWVRMQRASTVRRLNLCGLPNSVATDGVCLLGAPLPRPERCEMNVPYAWHELESAHEKMSSCLSALNKYWRRPKVRRKKFSSEVGGTSARAAEHLCKALFYLRGIKIEQSHSVDALCRILRETAPPDDPLVPLLEKCNGRTVAAGLMAYGNRKESKRKGPPHEDELVSVSALRLANAIRATGGVLRAVCDRSTTEKHSLELDNILGLKDEVATEAELLESSECPAETVQKIRDGMALHPPDHELRYWLSRGVEREAGASRGR